MKKHLMLIVCLLVCVFAFGGVGVSAAPTAWDGTVDTSWYDKDQTSFEIDTPEKLAGLAAIVNGSAEGLSQDNFAGKTVKLTADLDLGGVEKDGAWSGQKWTPIGSGYSSPFNGTFLGEGHDIANLYVELTVPNAGLFGYLEENAKISSTNIVSGKVLTTSSYAAGIAGTLKGVVLNCHNSADITSNTEAGGIAGSASYATAVIFNCSNDGTILTTTETSNAKAGGIAGAFDGKMINCYNSGIIDITKHTAGTTYAGGIVGAGLPQTASLINVYNVGNVLTKDGLNYVGAICGDSNVNTAVINCYYLKTDTINSNLIGIGKPKAEELAGMSPKNEAELKGLASALGEGFVADTGNINHGYPVLKWESTGVYDPDETEDLDIASATLNNGSLVVTLNKTLAYTKLQASDFTISATSQLTGEEAKEIQIEPTALSTSFNEAGTATVVTLTYDVINGTYKENTVKAQIAYGGKNPVSTGDLVIPISGRWMDYAADEFAGGDGTAANPYQIATPEQLALLAANVNAKVDLYKNKYFIQTADIDLKTAAINNTNPGWVPIGNSSGISFQGNYDGQNYTIKNMTLQTSTANTGLFGYLNGARLVNIKMDNVNVVSESSTVGALVGIASSAEITNCHVLSGSVSGTSYVGGLVGHFQGAMSTAVCYKMSQCSSAADVRGFIVGGLVGRGCYGSSNHPSRPTIYGNIEFANCYATGNVTCYDAGYNTNTAGGLIGDASIVNMSKIHHCYAVGTITVEGVCNVGGLVGNPGIGTGMRVPNDLTISNNVVLVPSISGLAEGNSYGRIAGLGTADADSLVAKFSDNYALSTMSLGNSVLTGEGDNDINGISKTTEELGTQSTWESLGFDMSENGAWKWDASAKRPVLAETPAKYDIYIVEHPQDGVAYANRDAKFYTDSRQGVGEHSYTWQRSDDNGKSWKDIKTSEGNKVLTLAGKLRWDGNLIRCKITDEGENVAYTNTAKLIVNSGDFDAAAAANDLYAKYQQDLVTTIKAPTSLYSLTGDISDCDVLIHYYDSYDIVDTANAKGTPVWAAIDYMAQGNNPSNFLKTGSGVANPESVNLIAEYLAMQNENNDGSFIAKDGGNDNKDGIMSNIYYTLALDIYFNGAATWGNENEEGTTGRTAAFNYLLTQLKDDTKTDGRYFYNLTRANGTYGAQHALRYNAEFVILMARFTNDPVLGKQATAAMRDVLEMLEWQYDNGKMDDYTVTAARYASALVAAANVTDSKSLKASYEEKIGEVFEKLMNAWAKDGTYAASMSAATPSATGDVHATAAVMMAFADIANQKAVLAEMGFATGDSEILATDVGQVSISRVVMENLTLPEKGNHGSRFQWKSSNEAVIALDGTVNRPQQDTKVTLTLTATYGTSSLTKDFVVTVPSQRIEGGDQAYADAGNLSLLPEYIYDISLPTEGANGSTITWSSSMPDVIASDGKVTRPAIGQEDAIVTLTATVTNGQATETKDFTVKVWANVDTNTNEGKVKESYYQCRNHYMHQDTLDGYWDVWAAYAALGDDIVNFNFYYNTSTNSASQKGAHVLALVAMGENPSNYKDTNDVEEMRKNGMGGSWSVPVFNTMAADAAGMKDAKPDLEGTAMWLSALSMGPDIGGWAAVPVSRRINENSKLREKAEYFVNEMSEDMVGNSMGSGTISMGCVVTGLTAFLAEELTFDGIEGLDVTKDKPWVK
ncbi:MAG: immunoglobulin-like domain-containing protein, partial [Bacillota bacterium]|nr:immunoglobulin-like domain-containing protein [Bacillota bacterium]